MSDIRLGDLLDGAKLFKLYRFKKCTSVEVVIQVDTVSCPHTDPCLRFVPYLVWPTEPLVLTYRSKLSRFHLPARNHMLR